MDPGLREIGGHHPGFVSALSDIKSVRDGSTKVTVYGHAKLNEFKAGKANIIRHFTTRFYKYFRNKPTFEQKNKYISVLTLEYLQIFERYNKRINRDVIFLYHTLCKEHAQALNLAIQLNKPTNHKLKHCVFLMFTPPPRNDISCYLDYTMSFKALSKNNNVQLFASDQETLHYNEESIRKTIKLHPCIFTSNVDKSNCNNNEKMFSRVLLFIGDAKSEKGFLELPKVMRSLTELPKSEKYEFVLQFTCGKYDKRILRAKDEIFRLAESDPRFCVHNGFWNESQITSEFKKADTIVLNYDKHTYQNKSSGVLWMAASRNLTMLFLTDSWLNREAERLGCNSTLTSSQALPIIVRQKLALQPKKQLTAEQADYREKIFKDFGDWIETTSNQLTIF